MNKTFVFFDRSRTDGHGSTYSRAGLENISHFRQVVTHGFVSFEVTSKTGQRRRCLRRGQKSSLMFTTFRIVFTVLGATTRRVDTIYPKNVSSVANGRPASFVKNNTPDVRVLLLYRRRHAASPYVHGIVASECVYCRNENEPVPPSDASCARGKNTIVRPGARGTIDEILVEPRRSRDVSRRRRLPRRPGLLREVGDATIIGLP